MAGNFFVADVEEEEDDEAAIGAVCKLVALGISPALPASARLPGGRPASSYMM